MFAEAIGEIGEFVEALPQHNDVSNRIATYYKRLLGRFEKELTDDPPFKAKRVGPSARRAYKRWQRGFCSLLDILPHKELAPFAAWHEDFFNGVVANHSSVFPYHRIAAKSGHLRDGSEKLGVEMREEIVNLLLAAGNQRDAELLFDSMAEDVLRIGFVGRSGGSGSRGRRVCNRSIQHRYITAMLAPKFRRIETGMKIVDSIPFDVHRLDGYRCLAKSMTDSEGMDVALEWADAVSNDDLRLAAYVGILESPTQLITTRARDTVILNKLDEIFAVYDYAGGC